MSLYETYPDLKCPIIHEAFYKIAYSRRELRFLAENVPRIISLSQRHSLYSPSALLLSSQASMLNKGTDGLLLGTKIMPFGRELPESSAPLFVTFCKLGFEVGPLFLCLENISFGLFSS